MEILEQPKQVNMAFFILTLGLNKLRLSVKLIFDLERSFDGCLIELALLLP